MDPHPGAITVRYASSRAEVWRAYWRSWARARGLWRTHVAFGVIGGALLASLLGGFGVVVLVECCAAVFAACLLLFPLAPQFKFKPAERELTISADGWKTAIGALSGSRRWIEVRSVHDTGETIEIIGVNGNILIVPHRAFGDPQARAAFVQAATRWHAAASS
jgi:hypothetical protein